MFLSKRKMGVQAAILAAAVVEMGLGGSVMAAYWKGTTSNDWGTASNWSAAPADGFTATFDRLPVANGTTIAIPASGGAIARYIEFGQASGQTAASYTIGVEGGTNVIKVGASSSSVVRLLPALPSNITATFNAPILLAINNVQFQNNASDGTSKFVFNGNISNNFYNSSNPSAKATLVLASAAGLTGSQGTGANVINGVISDGDTAHAAGSVQAVTLTAAVGSWTLAGDNTYTGRTTVTGSGTLFVTGSIANGAAVGVVGSVDPKDVFDVEVSTGVLAGNGTISGDMEIKGTGTLSVGDITGSSDRILNVGKLWLHGDASNTPITKFDIASASSFDQLVSVSDVTFGGTLDVTLASSALTGTWKIFDFATYGGSFTSVVVHNLGANATADFNAATGELTVAVPEPGTLGSLVFAAGAAGLLRRNRRR